jgi:hypothetical protein
MLGMGAAAAFALGNAPRIAPRLIFSVGIFSLLLLVPRAQAADSAAPSFDIEIWAGADAAPHAWLAYSGVTIAPYGDMFRSGIRLRTSSGYGQYSYTGERTAVAQEFSARTSFGDVLVGYLQRWGPLTAKAFVGAAMIQHHIRPHDSENPVSGTAYGPKVVAEFWLNTSASSWSSLDLSWTSAHRTYAGRLRSGYRVFTNVSLGAETRIDGNELDRDARCGLFVRYDWSGGEVSLAGGVSGRFFEDAQDITNPYATLTWLMQY